MEIMNLTISKEDVDRHSQRPSLDVDRLSVLCPDPPQLTWYRIRALGFGDEAAETRDALPQEECRAAAELFAASGGKAFSLLCERRKGEPTVFAVGCQDDQLPISILKSAFGTVGYEPYEPAVPGGSGLYGKAFDPIAPDADGRDDGNDAVFQWADQTNRLLTRFPGIVRLDFHPLQEDDCRASLKAVRDKIDRISAYLESSFQVSDNVSRNFHGEAVTEFIGSLKAANENEHSSSGSVSWKNADAALEEAQEKARFFLRILTQALQDGWILDFYVSADMGDHAIDSTTMNLRANALTVPLSAAIVSAGYTCTWADCNQLLGKEPRRGLLLPTAQVKRFVSLPTLSDYGFERKKNRYYNVNVPEKPDALPFANLMQYECGTDVVVSLPREQINCHVFVCGMTGAGKTSTVHHLLSNMGDLPFLVIEPVKSEYQSLPGVTVRTMTAGSSQMLSLNPFWFPEGSSLQYHIDCLKLIISSAFDLYAAMPNILEQCLVRVYLHCGWDFIQGTNRYAQELPEDMLYPTFSDLCQEVDQYLVKAQFGEETKGNYRGALLSRLQSFTSGAKGMLLNTTEHIDFAHIAQGKTVVTLDSLADDADKSIVMGVILAQYYQYLKVSNLERGAAGLRHITVIEEAHHLFAGDDADKARTEGGGPSASQALVKTLNNMLAEIRAYGEGFIIVDQSPSSLHPAVLKNTGVKVAHRIDYGVDMDAMRDVLLLDASDCELATLLPGQALIRFGGMHSPAKVCVPSPGAGKGAAHTGEKEVISGNSMVTQLREDEALSRETEDIVYRMLNQLLFDSFGRFSDFYKTLHTSLFHSLIRRGYAELLEDEQRDRILSDYLSSFIPQTGEKLLPSQYCTIKMLYLFARRMLSIAAASNGEPRQEELNAFQDYREQRLWPRMRLFWSATDSHSIMRIIFAMNDEVSPETMLIALLVRDLQAALKSQSAQLNETQKAEWLYSNYLELLGEKYFLIPPADSVEKKLWYGVLCGLR